MTQYVLCKLEKNDFIRTRKLYEEVFPEDSKQFVDYYYEVKSQNSTALVLENENEEIISMLHLNPYEISVRMGEEFCSVPAYYIVAVATMQEYRHQGCMARLLKEAEIFCKERLVPFLFLMPANPDIYLPFGYTYIFSRPEFYFSAGWENSLIRLHQYPITASSLTERTESLCQVLAEFSQKLLEKQFDFFVKRDNIYYVNLLKELEAQKGEVGIYYSNNEIVGYYTKTGEAPNMFCGEDGICEALFTTEFEELCKQKEGLPILKKKESHPIIMGKYMDGSPVSEKLNLEKGWIIETV